MKVFRCALFATLVIGTLASGAIPQKASAVMTVIDARCYGGGSSTVGGVTIQTPGFCDLIYGDIGGGGGGGGGAMPPSGGGAFVPNQGDKKATPRDANAKTSCDQAGEPVVFSTGNEVMPEEDFASAGEMGLSLTRTYNHYWDGIGIFGRRWLSDYDYKLLFTTHDPTSPCYTRPGNTPCDATGGSIWALRPDGRQIKFNYSSTPAPGWYEDKPSPIARIVKSGSTYTLYSEDHTVEVYDAHGFPATISNQQGVSWTFSYDTNHYVTRVTHSSGRHVDFGWSNGLLTQITDPDGNVYRYGYATIPVTADTSTATQAPHLMLLPPPGFDDPPPTPPNPPIQSMVALLISATPPFPYGPPPVQPALMSATQPADGGTAVTYHYEDSRFVTALTGKSINGSRWSWITYDANARVVQTQLAGGVEQYQFAYTLDGDGAITSTTITNPLGRQTTYDFDAKGNRVAVAGLPSTHCPASYKALEYDANGYLSGVTDFNGNVTLFTYAADGQLQQKVEASGTSAERITDYTWDTTYHRPTRITVEGDHQTDYSYDANQRLASVTTKNLSTAVAASSGETRTTTFTYATWSNGLVKSVVVDGPRSGLSDAITLAYADTGDLLSRQDALGHTTTYGDYNGLGLPGYVTGPNGDKRSFVYDPQGRVEDEQTHRNGGTQHTYYTYDGFGRLKRVIDPDGDIHGYQYDVAGRLLAEFGPAGEGAYDETVYTYNAMSLPVSVKKQRVFSEPAQGTVP